MNNVRTVSDTKREFYTHYTRPINSIYRRVVEELMVEMHLLSVHDDFSYDPIYALGVVTSFNRFMQGYRPERDKDAMFEALCLATESNPQEYQQDAEQIQALAQRFSTQELVSWLNAPTPVESSGNLHEKIAALAQKPRFKYSRLFAIGLYTLLEITDREAVKDDKQRTELFQQICSALRLPQEKVQKDLDLYRSNLEKMAQVQLAIADALNADRKKREQRAQAQAATASQPSNPPADEAASDS